MNPSQEAGDAPSGAVSTVVLSCGCRYATTEDAPRMGAPARCVVHGVQRAVAFDAPAGSPVMEQGSPK